MQSEKQKMLAGALYDAGDPQLVAERQAAELLLRAYNGGTDSSALLRRLLGRLGEGSVIRPPFFCDYGYNIRLGRRVFVNFNCVFLDVAPIEVGDFCQIGPAVQVYAADHPRDPAQRRDGLESGKPVRIGENAWIGGGAIILPGVTIGADAVIGAGSVVIRDVPAGATVVGNPARARSDAS